MIGKNANKKKVNSNEKSNFLEGFVDCSIDFFIKKVG